MTPSTSYERTLGRVLRGLRKQSGLTQEQFARYCGLDSQSAWSRCEQGKVALPVCQLVSVAKLLGLAPGRILDLTDAVVAELKKTGVAVRRPEVEWSTDGTVEISSSALDAVVERHVLRSLVDVSRLTDADLQTALGMIAEGVTFADPVPPGTGSCVPGLFSDLARAIVVGDHAALEDALGLVGRLVETLPGKPGMGHLTTMVYQLTGQNVPIAHVPLHDRLPFVAREVRWCRREVLAATLKLKRKT